MDNRNDTAAQEELIDKNVRMQELAHPTSQEDFQANLYWVAVRGTEDALDLLERLQETPPYTSDEIRTLLTIAIQNIRNRALIQATKSRLPAKKERRLKRLIAKSERGTLSPKELDEYRILAQRAEQINVTRVEALAELVRLRGKPVNVIMKEVGWENGLDGAPIMASATRADFGQAKPPKPQRNEVLKDSNSHPESPKVAETVIEAGESCKPRIFLCHASEDQPEVEAIYGRLRDEGFVPWMDKIDLLPGQRWRQEIPRVLCASDFVLVFLSPNSVAKRSYVQREFKLAIDTLEEMPEGVIHTIPIRLDDCEIPEQFADLHWANLFEADGFDRVVQAIRAGWDSRRSRR